jgi:hypothetical protein
MYFFLNKCMSILLGSFEVLRTNNCLTMFSYHYACGPKDKHVEISGVD